MSLVQSGELLAVTSENVNPPAGASWSAFESRKAVVFDGQRAVEVSMSKDFPAQHWMALVQQASKRPQVSIEVSVGKGERLYGLRILQLDDETLAA